MRSAILLVVVVAALCAVDASRVTSSRRVALGARASVASRASARAALGVAAAAATQATAQSGVSFVFSGKKEILDTDVSQIVPRANKAHTVTGPTSAGAIGKRLNNAGTPKQFAVVHLDVETVTGDAGVRPLKTGTNTPATDADWAGFAATSTQACGEGDFDIFLIAHRTKGSDNPFLWKRGGRHGNYIDATYLWTNFVKHVDKRTKRVIVCACYGWLGRQQFADAVSKWNQQNPTKKWDPLFIANEQPMSLTEDGEWSTMTEEAVKALQPNDVLDMTKLSQTTSMKDLHVMQNGAEISPFPKVTLASVQKFQTCRKTSVNQGVNEDRAFAKAVLVDPSAVTQKQVDDAIASIPACAPAPAAPIATAPKKPGK